MGQFLRPVVRANLAAWPLAYIALNAYLVGFDQRAGRYAGLLPGWPRP